MSESNNIGNNMLTNNIRTSQTLPAHNNSAEGAITVHHQSVSVTSPTEEPLPVGYEN